MTLASIAIHFEELCLPARERNAYAPEPYNAPEAYNAPAPYNATAGGVGGGYEGITGMGERVSETEGSGGGVVAGDVVGGGGGRSARAKGKGKSGKRAVVEVREGGGGAGGGGDVGVVPWGIDDFGEEDGEWKKRVVGVPRVVGNGSFGVVYAVEMQVSFALLLGLFCLKTRSFLGTGAWGVSFEGSVCRALFVGLCPFRTS